MTQLTISEALYLNNILVKTKIDSIKTSSDRYAIVNLVISLNDTAEQWEKVIKTANEKFTDTGDRNRFLNEESRKSAALSCEGFSEETINQLIDGNVSTLELGALAFLRKYLAK